MAYDLRSGAGSQALDEPRYLERAQATASFSNPISMIRRPASFGAAFAPAVAVLTAPRRLSDLISDLWTCTRRGFDVHWLTWRLTARKTGSAIRRYEKGAISTRSHLILRSLALRANLRWPTFTQFNRRMNLLRLVQFTDRARA